VRVNTISYISRRFEARVVTDIDLYGGTGRLGTSGTASGSATAPSTTKVLRLPYTRSYEPTILLILSIPGRYVSPSSSYSVVSSSLPVLIDINPYTSACLILAVNKLYEIVPLYTDALVVLSAIYALFFLPFFTRPIRLFIGFIILAPIGTGVVKIYNLRY